MTRPPFRYKVRLPYEFGIGVSWSVPTLTLAFDAHYADWRQAEYKDRPSEFVGEEYFRKKYKDTWRVHLGGEFLLPFIPINVRAGFYRDPIPFIGPRESGDPEIEIINKRDYLTLGAGTLIDQVLAIDIAWVRGISEQKEGNLAEKHEEDRVFMSAAYRF
jgi:long-subunit fatty acid transport protein